MNPTCNMSSILSQTMRQKMYQYLSFQPTPNGHAQEHLHFCLIMQTAHGTQQRNNVRMCNSQWPHRMHESVTIPSKRSDSISGALVMCSNTSTFACVLSMLPRNTIRLLTLLNNIFAPCRPCLNPSAGPVKHLLEVQLLLVHIAS